MTRRVDPVDLTKKKSVVDATNVIVVVPVALRIACNCNSPVHSCGRGPGCSATVTKTFPATTICKENMLCTII